ncbi:Rho1 guanine nucleotide exchange factor 1 [Psilocybe cubensis]|uniref:Uncharacterized protein n=2 Tax=Psilocybe cubensis TaxID=181762 RepID=A0A8H7XT16_PSICU|nr:Rho1 guanine nucleotide exchange factor 1 [Psilocybe cubensis]KAH9479303.1 Rho1 guanine nucleotide exchange factor 1 [Psilocybe cubensis]
MSSAFALDTSHVTPGEDALNELFDAVIRQFSDTPISPAGSEYLNDVYGDSDIERHRSFDGSVHSIQHSSSYTPSPLSQHSSSQIPSRPSPSQTSSSGQSRPSRPLPRPPGASSAPTIPTIPTTNTNIPQSSFSQSTPSAPQVIDAPTPSSDRKSRIYSRAQPNLEPIVDAPIDNAAGPSGSQQPWSGEADNIPPTSPSTEFPEHNAYLPGYVRYAAEDPNATASLGRAPEGIDAFIPHYEGPPSSEPYEESVVSGESGYDSRYQSIMDPHYQSIESGESIRERWERAPDVSTFIDGYLPILNPPNPSVSRIPRPADSIHEEPEPYEPSVSDYTIPEALNDNARSQTNDSYETNHNDWNDPGPSNLIRNPTQLIQQIARFQSTHLELHEKEGDPFDEDDRRFINPALLSHLAVQLRDKVTRDTHVKGSIPYPRSFTGKDIVSTIHCIIQERMGREHSYTPDRKAALLVARSLQTMLFFYEVEWGAQVLQDGVEDVYMFMDDQEGGSDAPIERAELPTGVNTILTKCYSASCDGAGCYAYGCPRKGMKQLASAIDAPERLMREDWTKKVPTEVLTRLSQNEINRQTIIHKLISKEVQYIQDLEIIEKVFIQPLRTASPPVMTPLVLSEFVDEVFGNILELLECNRRLLEFLEVRQREQYPVIQSIGDIFLEIATEFRIVYPTYVGHHPLAEKRLKEELEHNLEFRLFIEKCSRQLAARPGSSPRLDLKHYLSRPAEHLQKYPVLLDAVYRETDESNPDGEFLLEAINAIQNLQNVAQLRTFQSAMGKGSTGKWEWHNLVSEETKSSLTNEECRRQSVIFELIKGEMAYVRDLENIETMYVRPLRNAEPPIIPIERLNQFLTEVFHNFNELHAYHRRLMDKLHEIQREEHPVIRSITPAIFDAALNFREAYMEYIPNYPIAAYRIDDEMNNNPAFKQFVNHTVRHPDAHRLDMKSFINRPIPRLLRYELLLQSILSETPPYHEDRSEIPTVIDLIKTLGRETEPGVISSKQKVELWKYSSNLVFKPGEHVDMDLLNEQRSLIHTGKLLRLDNGQDRDELFVMLFDNYFVMTHPREKDGITKYIVYRRPIPLDLLSLVNFTDNPVQRSTSILRNLWNNDRQPETASVSSRSADNGDTRQVYPFTIHHNGRLGGPYVFYAESAASRLEWKQKLDESLGLRKVVQESNKVFEIESLSVDTFILPALTTGPNSSVWHDGTLFTGKVTCSVPFNTPDGRGLVAIGCAEGVWIGYRHDSRSLRRVLHLKMVTQCAILEDFGLFLVLADKVLFAYHLEALVPTTPGSIHASQTPQKINGKDVHFFSVGVLDGRTLVIYMKKKGVCLYSYFRLPFVDLFLQNNSDSVFHAVEPVIGKINERPKASGSRSYLFRKTPPEWFRPYKEFSFPDAHDLIFLRARIAVLCAKGFMIMDLKDYKSVTIPQRDDPKHPYLAKRCDSCHPMGLFRSREDEFLLCYNEFGLFVDRHGHPSRSTGIIEWEGTADRVAMHAPYVLLFDTRFIEIRHLETGRLVQIISGNDIRCVWDGRSLDSNMAVTSADGAEDRMEQEPRVHAVMNMTDLPLQPGGRTVHRGVMQHVFELFPTIPLYLPGSLSSPTTAPYFPLSFSPPRSPPLRPHHI